MGNKTVLQLTAYCRSEVRLYLSASVDLGTMVSIPSCDIVGSNLILT